MEALVQPLETPAPPHPNIKERLKGPVIAGIQVKKVPVLLLLELLDALGCVELSEAQVIKLDYITLQQKRIKKQSENAVPLECQVQEYP